MHAACIRSWGRYGFQKCWEIEGVLLVVVVSIGIICVSNLLRRKGGGHPRMRR